MKRKLITTSLLVAGILISPIVSNALAESKKQSKTELQAKATVTEAQARKIALAKVPKGKIKESELEEENGRLVWSFDLATPGTKDITEVQVDAKTSEVVSVVTETAKDEAREAKEEKAAKKSKAK
ncbi:MAG: PepSY domain-containing protein [Opitutus sp.]